MSQKTHLNSVLTLILPLILVFNSTAYGHADFSIKPQLNLESLKRDYPSSEIRTVTLAQLHKIKDKYRQKNPINEDPCQDYKMIFYSDQHHSPQEDTDSPIIVPRKKSISPSYNFDGTFKAPKDKDFLVFVAVIGVVVVAALFIYAGSYIYNSFKNGLQCSAWTEWGYRYSNISDDSSTQLRQGRLNGLYFSKAYFYPSGTLGFTAEMGSFDMDLKLNGNSTVQKYSGAYLLVGPTFTFPITFINKQSLSLELLGGSTFEKRIGFMSTMRLSYGLHVNDQFNISLGLGAAFIQVKGLEGFLGHYDDLNYLTGFKTTFKY